MRPFASQILQTILLASMTATLAHATAPVALLQGTSSTPSFSPTAPRPNLPMPPSAKTIAFSPTAPRPNLPMPPSAKVHS